MDVLGAPDTAEGFRAQIRRDLGATATRGMGAWYYDMGGGWQGDEHPQAKGYAVSDAMRLGVNVVTYAMTH